VTETPPARSFGWISVVLGLLANCAGCFTLDVERPATAMQNTMRVIVGLFGLGGTVLAIRALVGRRQRGPAVVAIVLVVVAGLQVAFGAKLREVTAHAGRPLEATRAVHLAFALLDYEKEHGTLPPAATFSLDGKPLLSWRVLVLPYLGERELYQQFKLDEPWDSPHNIPLLRQMPQVFALPDEEESQVTNYQVVVGSGAAFEGRKGIKLADFTDGLGQTLLVVQAADPVAWTMPADLLYEPGKPLPRFKDKGYGVLANGANLLIPGRMSDATLRALITRKAGDKPGDDFPLYD
jgi:hypothetical protein